VEYYATRCGLFVDGGVVQSLLLRCKISLETLVTTILNMPRK
jgi:hypothetical protein